MWPLLSAPYIRMNDPCSGTVYKRKWQLWFRPEWKDAGNLGIPGKEARQKIVQDSSICIHVGLTDSSFESDTDHKTYRQAYDCRLAIIDGVGMISNVNHQRRVKPIVYIFLTSFIHLTFSHLTHFTFYIHPLRQGRFKHGDSSVWLTLSIHMQVTYRQS